MPNGIIRRLSAAVDSVFTAVLAVSVFLVSAGSGRADDIVLVSGQSYRGCSVDSYVAAQGIFTVRVANPDGSFSNPYSVPLQQVSQIQFSDATTPGKACTVVGTSGKEISNLKVLGFGPSPEHGYAFSVTQDNNMFQVPVGQISQLTVAGAPGAVVATPTPAESSYSGDSSSYSGSSSSSSSSDSEKEDDDEGFGGRSTRMGGSGLFSILAMGLSAILLALFLLFLINVLWNSVIIFIITKLSRIPDITWKKCFLCALFLGILPIVCIPLLLIPFIGIGAYLFCVIGGARMIVMGTLEVLEGTAWFVIIMFIASGYVINKMVGAIVSSMVGGSS